jgi:hypothetical protein
MPAFPPQDRLIRKEVALGTIRELEPPTDHIGEQIAPMMEVASDDVIFDYARGLTDGLAPARAEDAEAELAQKDLMLGGTGRASVIDWAIKDYYTASDVARYRETLLLAGRLGENAAIQLPLSIGSQIADFQGKVARDEALRRRKLDNRLEWLRVTPLDVGGIAYNDGKIKFSIDYGRPADQTDEAPAALFNDPAADPIGEILKVQEFMFNRYGITMSKVIGSKKIMNNMWKSSRFTAMTGLVVGGVPSSPIDMNYVGNNWSPAAAQAIVENATGVQFQVYDAVYRTRPIGSTTITNTRFLDETKLYFLPDEASIAALDDAIGFAKTLTSPHPEGNWTPGFYEWEEENRDPWNTTRGTGIKAFPVFMHMDWTYTMKVLP